MRKIEEKMLDAIKAGKTWKKSNTEVETINHMTYVYLFGNEIAVLNRYRKELTICNCGWETPTTSSRLSAILGELMIGHYFTYIQRGRMFYCDTVNDITHIMHGDILVKGNLHAEFIE